MAAEKTFTPDYHMPYRAKQKIESLNKKLREAQRQLQEMQEIIRAEYGDFVADVYVTQTSSPDLGLYIPYELGCWDDEVLTHWVNLSRNNREE